MMSSVFLWLLVWGGMFTSIDAVGSESFLRSGMGFLQGIRSLFPLAALFFCLLWILRSGRPFRSAGIRSCSGTPTRPSASCRRCSCRRSR